MLQPTFIRIEGGNKTEYVNVAFIVRFVVTEVDGQPVCSLQMHDGSTHRLDGQDAARLIEHVPYLLMSNPAGEQVAT